MDIKPKKVEDEIMAFPANVIGEYLPAWEDIPDRFKNLPGQRDCEENTIVVNSLFFNTFSTKSGKHLNLSKGLGFIFHETLDMEDAFRHLYVCLKSRESSHEHKIAGVSYLCSLWLEALCLDGKVFWSKEGSNIIIHDDYV